MIATRSPHLQAMGIQQWVRRDLPQQEPSPVVAEPESAVVVPDFSAQVTLQGVVGVPLMLIIQPLEPAAEQLLTAMLRAIGIDVSHCYRMTLNQPTLFSNPDFVPFLQQQIEQSNSAVQLQLGAETALLDGLFHCADPAHLLLHPEEKRATWETLKRLHRQLNS